MKFERAALSLPHLWSSPFVRWQGALADISSIDLACAVTTDALKARGVDPAMVDRLVLGSTVPQAKTFYAAPWLAARLGMPGISGPLIAQACATSVVALTLAACAVEMDAQATPLLVVSDRTSNGPLLVYPQTAGQGGAPQTEHWVLDNFAADPNTGQAMIATAETTARDGAMGRAELDDLSLLRWQQYQHALADDRRFQRQYMVPVRLTQGRKAVSVEADEGVHAYSAEGLAALRPVVPSGVVTFGGQTHPADGCAGALVCDVRRATTLSGGQGVVRLLAVGQARAAPAEMPKAATTAAQNALALAGLSLADVRFVVSHNPFAVNDLWFARQTGFPLERMNPFGCSLIYGHPQGPTGLRGIAELAWALRQAGGGVGLFTGCAAGDTGAAVVLRVD